jgi:hypothetical protein
MLKPFQDSKRNDENWRDESAREDLVVAAGDCCDLDHNANDEHTGCDQDSVLPRAALGKETGHDGSEPRTQLQDWGEPALLGRVVNVAIGFWAVLVMSSETMEYRLTPSERVHGQNTTEHALVVTIQNASNAGEQSDAEHLEVLHERTRSTLAHEGLTPLESCIEASDRSASATHDWLLVLGWIGFEN